MLECFPADVSPAMLAGLTAAPHIGVDEAGRGCLAGPVVAAAVLFPPGLDPHARFPGLTDSKKLSAANREKLYPLIRAHALWSLGISWPEEIDEVNILNATFRAMSRAAVRLATLRGVTPLPRLLVDGNHPIRAEAWMAVLPGSGSKEPALPPQTPVIGGDALIPAISAASVVAKVFRDMLMAKLDRRHPGYGFAVHKGYGTAGHRAAIREKGLTPMHRKSFKTGAGQP